MDCERVINRLGKIERLESRSSPTAIGRSKPASKQSMNSSICHRALILSGLLALSAAHSIWALHPGLGGPNWSGLFIKRPHLVGEESSEEEHSGPTSAPVVTANSFYGDSASTPTTAQTNPTLAPNRHAHDILIDHLAQLEPSRLAKTVSNRLRELLRRLMECRPTRPTSLLNCNSTSDGLLAAAAAVAAEAEQETGSAISSHAVVAEPSADT